MIDGALSDPSWDDYDQVIKNEVVQYSARLRLTADWRIFKAQAWTESGAASPAWKSRPMQIGNPSDPAYDTLKRHKENSDLIMSDGLKRDLQTGRSIDDPKYNIQLGIAYAYTKLSTFQTTVLEPVKLVYEVKPGDSIDKIASIVGTTKQNLLKLNPSLNSSASMIFPKEKLTYQKSAIRPVSCLVTAARLQSNYNGNGDPAYAEKIKYCLGTIEKLKR
jgi:LysM repeat protein